MQDLTLRPALQTLNKTMKNVGRFIVELQSQQSVMASSKRSSSSSFTNGFTYDVFLSYRGTDSRHAFTVNLYKALLVRGIHAFIHDEELEKQGKITPEVSKAIEQSRIAFVVFSKDYASSSFCLDELVHISEHVKAKGRLVLPVFYDVDPSDVLHQRGSYGEAFSRHDEMFKDDKGKVQKWRDALHQVANLSASYHFKHGDGDEREFIERIVKVVSSRINRLPLHVADYPVGLESRLQEVCSFLDVGSDHRVLTVGIWGMGGIGKTTLARAVSNLVGDHFEGLSYLDNVREVSSKHGLVHLQKKLLLDMLGKKDFLFESVYEGASVIKTMIHRKKVLLIVDDVDSIEQLRALVGGPEWFGSGSRVIITTRDKHLLVHQGANKIYEARELNFTESLELLRWNAFRYGNVDPSYTEVLNQVVAYASGHPLALEVIGSNMFKKSVAEWTSALNRLKRIPHKGIQSMLKVSYDYLGEDEKRVFLDIACCFKGYDLTEVEDILRAHHGYNMKHHIGVLIEKSLLSVSSDGKVTLHPLLEDMGKEIVRQESPAEPGRRSRLWFSEDIVQVLEENMGTSSIEIIHLDFPFMQEVEWDGKAFKKMKKLKTLIIKKCHFSKAPIHLPNSLRVLEWWRYPSEELPSDFHAKKLAILKPAKLLKESGRTLPKVPEVPRDYMRVSPLTLRILQRVFLGEKAWRPFDLLQALPSFLEVLQTSQRVPQLTLHTWLFQTKTVWRHFVLLHALESVPVILQTSQVVPNVNLQTSQRIFQVETVCTHVGLQTSLSIPGVIPTFVMVPEVMLQTSMRAEMVWRLVGLASTVVGLFCHALSPSLKRLIGGWNFFKLFLYCVLSFVVCVTILFAKQFSLLRKPGQLKNYVIFAVLMIMSVYSFLYDKAVDGKPEIKSLVSNAAFALVSLSLSKLVKSGYEIGIFAYFLSCFTIQLVTINWALILVAIIFGCPLFVMHSSSHSTQNDGDGGHVIPFSLDSRPNVGRGGQHHVVDMPREERELQQRTNSLRSSVAL